MASEDSSRAAKPARDVERPVWSELELSVERWAFLSPRLHALLEDFRQLEALDDPTQEPVTAVEFVNGTDDAG